MSQKALLSSEGGSEMTKLIGVTMRVFINRCDYAGGTSLIDVTKRVVFLDCVTKRVVFLYCVTKRDCFLTRDSKRVGVITCVTKRVGVINCVTKRVRCRDSQTKRVSRCRYYADSG